MARALAFCQTHKEPGCTRQSRGNTGTDIFGPASDPFPPLVVSGVKSEVDANVAEGGAESRECAREGGEDSEWAVYGGSASVDAPVAWKLVPVVKQIERPIAAPSPATTCKKKRRKKSNKAPIASSIVAEVVREPAHREVPKSLKPCNKRARVPNPAAPKTMSLEYPATPVTNKRIVKRIQWATEDTVTFIPNKEQLPKKGVLWWVTASSKKDLSF